MPSRARELYAAVFARALGDAEHWAGRELALGVVAALDLRPRWIRIHSASWDRCSGSYKNMSYPVRTEVAAGGTITEPRLARRFWNLVEASKGRQEPDALGLSDDEVTVLNLVA